MLPIDKTAGRATQIFIAQYDLADPDALQALLELLHNEKHRVVAIHLAPACGTASKAREKKLTKLAAQGFKIPVPLRSQQKPMGLDKLSGLDKVRTETANQVYEATAAIIRKCLELDLVCSVENPENSLFWFYPDIEAVMQLAGGHSVSFHNCMHGGSRNKLTKWWATKDIYEPLRSSCDNKHKHAAWNPQPVGTKLTFPTASEAAYPFLLCKRVMAIVLSYAMEMGALDPDTLQAQLPQTSNTSHRWILDMLPKGKKLKPLVSEFQQYMFFLNTLDADPEKSEFFLAQPKGARLVQRQIQWGKVRVDGHTGSQKFFWEADGKCTQLAEGTPVIWSTNSENFQAELCTIVIPREPWDFLQRAVAAGHPRTLARHLNSEVTDMLRENFEGEPFLLVKKRAAFLMKWTERCKQLEVAEHELHNSLEPHLQKVLTGKRLLVLQEILEDLEYPDKSLVSDICKGFSLTGWLPKSGVFPPATKRLSHSMDAAMRLAQGVNHSICKQVNATGDDNLESEVWRQTEEEIAKNWAWLDENCDLEGKLLAKRFGLQQGEKVRLIDDCTIGGFNGTCGTSERLKVHSVDEIAAYIAWCQTNLSQTSMQEVVGKTYDLKNAYKQYGVSPLDRNTLRIAVWNPVAKQVQFLGINALPFGAIGSVSAFLRVSMAIWFIGIRGLRLCWTSFFDDFTLLSKQATANSASLAAEGLFQLLGVQFAQDGKKAVAWGTKVKTLGVMIDLKPGDGHLGYITLGHTESRVEELTKLLDGFIQSGHMSQKDGERLRGRLQWFECFAYGRVAQQALRTISGIASCGRTQSKLTSLETTALRFLRDRVLTAPPTKVQPTSLQTWMIFSDGACEGELTKDGTIGAVLVSPEGVVCRYFSERVPQAWMDWFLSETRHPIFELELLPVWVALCAWEQLVQHSQCIFYIDNEAAKGALINGATSTPFGKQMIQEFVAREMHLQVKVWFSRVPHGEQHSRQAKQAGHG